MPWGVIWLLAVVNAVGGLELYLLAEPLKSILGIVQSTAWWLGLPVIEYLAHRRACRRA
jgi:hypothetical protein